MEAFFYAMNLSRIGIQGVEGSFHQLAAKHYFSGEVKVVPAILWGAHWIGGGQVHNGFCCNGD